MHNIWMCWDIPAKLSLPEVVRWCEALGEDSCLSLDLALLSTAAPLLPKILYYN